MFKNLTNKIKSRYSGKSISDELYKEHLETEIKKLDSSSLPNHIRNKKLNKIKSYADANKTDFSRKGEDIARKNRSHDLGIVGASSIILQIPNLNMNNENRKISKNVQEGLNNVVNR